MTFLLACSNFFLSSVSLLAVPPIGGWIGRVLDLAALLKMCIRDSLIFMNLLHASGYDFKDPEIMIYMLIELVSGCLLYTSSAINRLRICGPSTSIRTVITSDVTKEINKPARIPCEIRSFLLAPRFCPA